MPNDTDASKDVQEEAAKAGIDPQELAKLVNSAVSSQLKRALSGLPDMLKKAVADALPAKAEGEGDDEEVAKAAAKAKAAKSASVSGASEADAARKAHDEARAAEVAATQKRLDKLESDLKEARKASAQANRRAAEEKGRASLRSALAASGIKEDAQARAALDLFFARGQAVIDDEGNVKLKLRTEFERGLGEEERELPLSEAMPHYMKTPEAALFMPPPTKGGQRPIPVARPPQQRPAGTQPTGNTLADRLAAEAERLSGGKPLNDTILT